MIPLYMLILICGPANDATGGCQLQKICLRLCFSSTTATWKYCSDCKRPRGRISCRYHKSTYDVHVILSSSAVALDGRCMTECVMTHPRMKIVDLYGTFIFSCVCSQKSQVIFRSQRRVGPRDFILLISLLCMT